MFGSSDSLPTIVVIVVAGLTLLVGTALIAFFAVPPLRRLIRQQNANARLMGEGISAKATVISAKQAGGSVEVGGAKSFQVLMQLHVEPKGVPAFVASATQYMNVLDLGKAQPGAAAVVRYRADDMSQVAIVSLLGPLSTLVDARGQDPEEAYQLVLDSEIAQDELSVHGVVAQAKVVQSLGTDIFLYGGAAEMTRLSLAIVPASGSSFTAETTTAIVTSSASKVQPGATVTVLYDPEQPTKVAVIKLSE